MKKEGATQEVVLRNFFSHVEEKSIDVFVRDISLWRHHYF
jgi:hypothetical protein